MPGERNDTRLLIAFSEAESFLDLFQERFPELPLRLVHDDGDVDAALAEFHPTVAFATPYGNIGRQSLRRILNWPTVRWFSNGGAGVEHLLPWSMAKKRVTNAAGVNAAYLGEYTITAIQMANIGFPRYAACQRRREWRPQPWVSLAGRKLAVLGLGRVGREVARRGAELGMVVSGVRARPQPTPHVAEVFGPDDLAKAAADADVVSVHAAMTAETRGLVGAPVFAAMRPGGIFLNLARGPVVDEAALIAALECGQVGTAILDVFAEEPLPPEHPFWAMENVIITPHMADMVSDWQRRLAVAFCANLERWIAGGELENIVDPERGY